jgi:mRNA interferase MazF
MTKFRRGDVVLVLFPNSDLRTFKKRPALIVQADNLDTGIPQLIVALITSNLERAGHPSRIEVLRGTTVFEQCGLKTDSIIVTDNLATVKEPFIDRALGEFTSSGLLDSALANTFGLTLADRNS